MTQVGRKQAYENGLIASQNAFGQARRTRIVRNAMAVIMKRTESLGPSEGCQKSNTDQSNEVTSLGEENDDGGGKTKQNKTKQTNKKNPKRNAHFQDYPFFFKEA